ncbi:MAG: GAF domain-containing protein, partial [Anaerolineae bacterium]|nr:GAF domain-containing protein [Anaerolineae bacterium]
MTTTQPAQAIPEETPSNGTDESAPVRKPADKVFNAEQNTPEPPTTTSPPDQYEGSGAVSDTEWVSHYSAQEFGLLLTRELDQDNLFRLIVSSSIKLTNATAGGLYLHGPNRSTLERVISVGSDAALVRVIVAHDKGLTGQAWELEKIVTSADSDTAAPPTSSLTPETRGNVALPLKSAGEFIGVLLLCRSWIHLELSPAEANALESLTAQSSLAIHNVQLITRERQLQLRAGALAAAAELAIQSEGLNESLIKLLEATLQAVPTADAGTVVFFDRGSAIRVAAGGEVDIIPPDFRPQYQDLCVLLGTTDGSRTIPDTQSYPEYFAESAVLRLRECRSLLLTPLLSNGTRIGILLLETGTREDAFGQAEAGFAESIARLMVSSTVQQEQRQATLKHLLFQKTMAELYSAQVNTGTAGAFSVLVDGLRQLPYCHRVNLLFLSSGSYGPPVRYSYSAMEATPLLPDLFKLMSVPLTSGQPELIPELGPGEATDVPRECYKAGFRSLLTVPLALGTEVIGGLNLLSQSPAAFSPEDVEFLENVSTALTTLVKNERTLISAAESRQSAEALLEAARQVNATLYADVV